MALRTTEEAVRAIIELDDDMDITYALEGANLLVTSRCASLKKYSDAELEMIERYVAAHLCTLLDPRTTSEQAGSVQVSYQSKVDLGLSTSHYGQMAIVYDYYGGLRKDRILQDLKWLGSDINNRSSNG